MHHPPPLPVYRSRDPAQATGLSLLELMVVMAMIGVIITLAAPALTTWLERAHAVSASRLLLTHLRYARSEAIKRDARIVVCPRVNEHDCRPDGNWRFGWFSFVDDNDNHRRDASEAIIAATRFSGKDPLHITFATRQNGGRYVRYRATGDAWPNGRFLFCPRAGSASERDLVIYRSGRARIGASRNGSDLRCA
jgi:type IV fimbrial biogenesis protein FimT